MNYKSSHRRALRSFPKRVLLSWLEARGISYFPEELEGVEKRLNAKDRATTPQVETAVARVSAAASACGLTVAEFADQMNRLTPEEVAQAMEQPPTDALEWAVKFEAMAHPDLTAYRKLPKTEGEKG